MSATWLPVPGYPDYFVSDDGRVRSVRRGAARDLACAVAPNGYRYVGVVNQDGRRNRTVHSLVALAFLGPPAPGQEVRHLDGDALNNSSVNLAYGSHSDNALDQVAHGTHNRASRSTCKQGHPFDTPSSPGRRRVCRPCAAAANRAYLTRKAAQR